MTQTTKDQATQDLSTPRPWKLKLYPGHIKFLAIETNNGRIYKAKYYPHYGNVEANARLIIKSVNNHDKLVEALKTTEQFFELLADASQSWDDYEKDVKNIRNKIKQALKDIGE